MIVYRLWNRLHVYRLLPHPTSPTGKQWQQVPTDPNNKQEDEFFHQAKAPKYTPTSYYTRESAEQAKKNIHRGEEYDIIPFEMKEVESV